MDIIIFIITVIMEKYMIMVVNLLNIHMLFYLKKENVMIVEFIFHKDVINVKLLKMKGLKN